jgi:uroporphyrin-III C-methyltransferase
MSAEDVRAIIIRTMTDDAFLALFMRNRVRALAEYELTHAERIALDSGDQDQIRRASTVPLPAWWPTNSSSTVDPAMPLTGATGQLDTTVPAIASSQATEQTVACDIYLLGLGIVACRHLTRETESALRECRTVFMLSNEPAIYRCLTALGPKVIALDYMYEPPGKPRTQVYAEMAEAVLDAARSQPPVAFACYGHPLFYSSSSRMVLDVGQAEGLQIKVLPGVSALDTLFVDLELDPAPALQLYEATAALVYRYELRPDVPCFLLQVGMLETGLYAPHTSNPARFNRLKEYLLQFYPDDHYVAFALSSTNPVARPKIIRYAIRDIEHITETEHGLMTLYVPPLTRPPVVDRELADSLEDPRYLSIIQGPPRASDW